ncbi:MAG: hypothetical protein MZV65_53150 [Chromatiales bacterium]|nr:hypothetical protein [Chromatiales bacterium]
MCVTPPAGTVFVAALPADFEVVQLNTMYFVGQGQYYVPYLSADGKELYVMVDRPPQPPQAPQAAARGAPRRHRSAPAAARPSGPSAEEAPAGGARRGGVVHGRRRHAPGRAAGRGPQFRDGQGGRPLPGLPRSGPRVGRAARRARRRQGVRRRQRRRIGQQDEGHRLVERHADRHAGGRAGAVDQDAAAQRQGRDGSGREEAGGRRGPSARRSARSPAVAKARPGAPRSAPAPAASRRPRAT